MPSRRAGHGKSRNGCLTCRIRKVKCDETRPYCRKCTETGRKCEGPLAHQFRFIHTQSSSQSTTPVPQLEVSLLAPQHSDDERRAFHYFVHRTAPINAGSVDAPFWEDLVPRLAQTYDFVWDTVVCLGSLLEHVPYTIPATTWDSTGLMKVTNQGHRRAIRFYNKAIVDVRRLAEHNGLDDSIVALSYILFASVEFQQRNVKTGNDLVKRCSEVLSENLTSLHSRQNSTTSQALYQVVTPFVLRRGITVTTLGSALPPQCSANNEVNNMLKAVLSRSPTLDDAVIQLYNLVHRCYEVIRHADFIPNLKAEDPNRLLFLSQRQLSLEGLMQWKASFTAISSEAFHVETDTICSYLLMYWNVCYIYLAACVSLRETIFDDYMDEFAQIIEHATACLKHGSRLMKAQILSNFDPGIIPLLYFCAVKCRDRVLRREALRLMRQAPRQENLWAFVAPDRVAAIVILAEEGEHRLLPSKNSPQPERDGFPPEERRFAYVNVVGREEPGGRQRQALEMSRFEFAADGSRRLVNEYIWLNDG